jgi:L-methionine (R)-S-oxide reductase
VTAAESAFQSLLAQLDSLIAGEDSFIANMANTSALIFHQNAGIRWIGFYLWDAERRELLLGPFQGLPAVARIPFGKGACGTAVAQGTTQLVQHPAEARSEMAIPLRQGKTIIGVFSIDSKPGHQFGGLEQQYLELYAAHLVANHVL